MSPTDIFIPPTPFHLVSSSSDYTYISNMFLLQVFFFFEAMPKVKRSRKPPPDGWELIEPTLDELDQKMREGERWREGGGWLNCKRYRKMEKKVCENEKVMYSLCHFSLS